eukprot:ANDGO_07522.mRNA.1 hypothetical protein AURANDRAFT_65000
MVRARLLVTLLALLLGAGMLQYDVLGRLKKLLFPLDKEEVVRWLAQKGLEDREMLDLSTAAGTRMPVGFEWQPFQQSGYGSYAFHLIRKLAASQVFYPVLLADVLPSTLAYERETKKSQILTLLWKRQAKFRDWLGDTNRTFLPFPVMHAEGLHTPKYRGVREMLVDFFVTPRADRIVSKYFLREEALVSGSAWNTLVASTQIYLRKQNMTDYCFAQPYWTEECSFPEIQTIYQGVDAQLFASTLRLPRRVPSLVTSAAPFSLRPADVLDPVLVLMHRRNYAEAIIRAYHSGKHLLFSGGKLEVRKGQDVIVEFMRRLLEKRTDIVLVVAWENFWQETINIQSSRWISSAPSFSDQKFDIIGDKTYQRRIAFFEKWLSDFGIPLSHVIVLPPLNPEDFVQSVFPYISAAVFANRAEGGINQVAAETVVAGIPTILSANTGHFDLLATCMGIPDALREAYAHGKYQTMVSAGEGSLSWKSGAEAFAAVMMRHLRAAEERGFPLFSQQLYVNEDKTYWAESDPDEIVRNVEWVLRHPKTAKVRADAMKDRCRFSLDSDQIMENQLIPYMFRYLIDDHQTRPFADTLKNT